jgi:hypothetical protein
MGPNDFLHFGETCDYVLNPVLSFLLEPWLKSPYSWPIPTSSFFEKEGIAQEWFKHQTKQKFQKKWFEIAIQNVIKSVQTCKSHLQHFWQLTTENLISDNQWPTFLNKNAIYAWKIWQWQWTRYKFHWRLNMEMTSSISPIWFDSEHKTTMG